MASYGQGSFRGKLRMLMLPLLVMSIIIPLLSPVQVSAQTSIESDFMATLNAERATMGKGPIVVNSNLTTAAYLHSKDMAEQNYFSHTSLDGRTFDQRIVAAGYVNYSLLGENIAYASGAPDASRVFSMWKNSSGHYANMMGDFNEAGLGVYSKNGYTYYTLDLGKRSGVSVPEFSSAAMLAALLSLGLILVVIARKRGSAQE